MRRFASIVVFALIAACGGASDSSGPKVDLTPVSLAAPGGVLLTGQAGQSLTITVHVSAAGGQGSPGASVSFAVTGGGGSVSPTTGTTDAKGDATTTWTLGRSIGANTLSVTSGALTPIALAATASAGPAANMVVNGTGFAGVFARLVSPTPTLTVTDAFQNPIAGAAVTLAPSAGGGLLAASSVTTDGNGQATLPAWTLGDVAGAQTVRATSGAASATITAQASNPWIVSSSSQSLGILTLGSVSADEGSEGELPAPTWANTTLRLPPQLSVSCEAGIVLVSVFDARLVTLNGNVTYAIDNGGLVLDVWKELSPSFDILFYPGSNAATKAFASQLSAGRMMSFGFAQFLPVVTYIADFNLHGLSQALPSILANCPGTNDLAPASIRAAAIRDLRASRGPITASVVKRSP